MSSINNDLIYGLFSLVTDYCFLLDIDGNIIDVNQVVLDNLNYTKDDILKLNVYDIHPKSRRKEAKEIIQKIIAGMASECNIPLKSNNGNLIPVFTKVKIIEIDKLNYILGISKDLTKEIDSITKFEIAFDESPQPMAITDLDSGTYLFINQAFENLFEYTKQEVIGHTSSEILPSITPQIRRQMLADLLISGKAENVKFKLNTKTGKSLIGFLSGKIFESNGRKFLLSSFQDITLNDNLINELQSAKERWNYALESSDLGVWDWNLITNEVFFSKKWKSMLGFEYDEISNSLSTWEELTHPEDLSYCYNEISKHLRGEIEQYQSTHRIKNKSGDYIWILDTGKVVEFDNLGNPSRFVGTHRDISEIKAKEKALSEQHDWNRTIFESAKAGIVIIDTNTFEVVDVNQTACDILKFKQSELIGKKCGDFFCLGQNCCEYKTPDFPILNKEKVTHDSEGKELTIIKSLIQKQLNNKLYNIESFVDITDLKSKEKEIVESQRQLELFFNQSLAGFFFMKTEKAVEWNNKVDKNATLDYIFNNQKVTKVNQSMISQYNAKEEQMIGLTPRYFFSDNIEYGKQIYKTLFDSGKIHLNTTQKKLDGTEVIIEADYTCLYDINGRIIGMFGIQQDVTKKQLFERLVKEKTAELEKYFDISMDLIIISDMEGRFKRFNNRWVELLGISPEELKDYRFLDFVHPEDIEETIQIMKSLSMNKPITGFVNRYRNKLNEYVYIEWNSIYQNGVIYGAGRDITQMIEDKKEIIKLLDQSRETNEAIETMLYQKNVLIEELESIKEKLTEAINQKDKFVSIMAHDLRSPLNGFIGLTRLMAEDIDSFSKEEIQEIAEKLNLSSNHLSDLLENLLSWSMTQRGLIEFNPIEFDLIKIISKVIATIKLSAEQKGITLFFDQHIDSIFVTADINMVQTILRNLISNAIKFSNADSTIIIEVRESEKDYIIKVKDSGIGMSPELLAKLFKMDEKTTRTGTADEKSTGLGLLLCNDYAVRNNGNLTIESQENIGTTVYFSLPK